MVPEFEALIKEIGAIGSGLLLAGTGLLTAIGTYKATKAGANKTMAEGLKLKADAQKTLAEAKKLDTESRLAVSEANCAEACRSVEFEKALNDRAIGTMAALDKQIAHLSELVEMQNKRIQEMEEEIKELRIALDRRTQDLHQARSIFPPICKRCEFFTGEITGCMRGKNGEVCKFETPTSLPKNVVVPLVATAAIPKDEL